MRGGPVDGDCFRQNSNIAGTIKALNFLIIPSQLVDTLDGQEVAQLSLFKTRIRRSAEERLAEIEEKIAYHKTHIEALNARKETLLHPQKRRRVSKKEQIAEIIKMANESGLSLPEIMEKLGLE